MDITRQESVAETVENIRPDLIINCAAHTGVDACESEEERARDLNVAGPRYLAESALRQGSLLVHVSTDYVFDGQKPTTEGYSETDQPGPLSVYGKTKLAGERAVSEATDHHVILRTAWLYGIHGHNFLKTMLRLACADPRRELKVVNDQFGSPTWSYRLALQIARLVDFGGRGIYHGTAEGYGTWYELARYFLEQMGVEHNIEPCTTADYPTPAVRPKNAILENGRFKAEGIHVMKDWRRDIERYVSEFRGQLMGEVKKEASS